MKVGKERDETESIYCKLIEGLACLPPTETVKR